MLGAVGWIVSECPRCGFDASAAKTAVEVLGVNIVMLRRQNRLSQVALERLAGISHSELWRIENGTVDVRLSTLVKLGDAFSLRVVDLFRPMFSANGSGE